MTHTHTIARLPVSNAAYDEIRGLLENAGYRDYLADGTVVLDMTGLGLERKDPLPRVNPFAQPEFAEQGHAWKAALDEWSEGGTLGRLERAKTQIESLAQAADRAGGMRAEQLRDILILTIEDAIVQVQQDDRFIAEMAKEVRT